MIGHVHVGLPAFIATVFYIIVFNISARILAGHLAHTPLGRALAFIA